MIKANIAIAEKLLGSDTDKLIRDGICERIFIQIRGFRIKALLFNKEAAAIQKILRSKKTVFFNAKFNGSDIQFASTDSPADSVEIDLQPPKDSSDGNKWPVAKRGYRKILREVSAITDCQFALHCNGDSYRDPFPDEPCVYNIFVSAAPTGEKSFRYLAKVLDKWLGDPDYKYLGPDAVPGRGYVLTDPADSKQKIIQIVGNNIFFLFPCIEVYSHGIEVIFQEALAMAWNCAHYKKLEKEEEPTISQEEVKEAIERWMGRPLESLGEIIKERMDKVEDAQNKLNKKLSNLAFLLSTRESLLNPTDGPKPDYGQEYERLVSDSRIKNMRMADDGIIIVTNSILSEHEGHKYDLGVFSVRINKLGVLSIWCEKTTHPKGIPQPHMQLDGAVCFGNATRAIQQAAAELRIADAFTFVLEWLEYGHAPEYALNKIQEWPCRS